MIAFFLQIIHASENPVPLGNNVTIISNTNVTVGTWTFNNNLLALIYPGGFYLSNAKSGKLIFDSNTSSLTIISAQLADSGVYKLEQLDKFSVQLWLSVQEPISNVTLSAQRTDLVELNDTAVFICSVSKGTSLSYEWLAGNSTILSRAGVQLSNGGANLSIVGLTRYDQGPYRCNVSNGLGYEVSPPVYLNISYGPNNATMTVDPVNYMYRSGSNITLSCSVKSKPTAIVQWMFNGVSLNQFGLQLHLQNVKENNSGTYKCLFHNTVTMLFNSDSTVIRVMDPLSAVDVSITGRPAILDEAFTLQCGATGPVGSIQWWKNGSLIAPDNRTMFGNNNKTLTLKPVRFSDGGLYRCHVFNLVSDMTNLICLYGPMMPTVTGPNVVKSGNTVTFKCSAESVPPSLYQWHFNGSVVSAMSEYTTPSLTEEMSGAYICMALNNITGKNSTASIMLTVVDPIQNVTVQAQNDSAIEGNPHVLTCDIIGPADNIYWMENGEPLYSDNRTGFFMNNMTVKFTALKRSDTGNYQCLAINAVGNMTSDPYKLLVTYGPDTAETIGPNVAKTGDNVTLTCWADSAPLSLYQWHFNGVLVSNMSEYMTPSLTEEMSGEYTCTAINSISGKNSTASIMLKVIAPIQNVQVEAQMNLAVEGHPYNLTCSVNGAVDNIYWMRNGEKLNSDNRTMIFMENMTMSFMSMQRNDAGNYTCMAANAVGNMTSKPFMLLVNYGPEMPVITGPTAVKTGDNATLRCHAKSVPPSLYQWHFNGSLVSIMSEYMTPPLTEEKSVKYTCTAFNNVTEKTSTMQVISTVFSMDNKTVMFMPVDRYDAGDYECMAMNAVGNLTSNGPLNINISGPESAKDGASVSLTCTTESYPECDFHWFLNNQSSPLKNGSVFSFTATRGPAAKYICIATNPVTNITMKQTKDFTIQGE
uniref:Ig-like domain-containing protein n=1 Tax=Xiphophorus couchianus TaxID=32473 RepID=A0A3B5MPB3_9TELE